MNESTWRYRVEALKATERQIADRERKCKIREVAISRAIEQGVNPRQERQIFDLVEKCIEEYDTKQQREFQKQFHQHHDNNARLNIMNCSSSSAVTALDEVSNVAADLDSMRRTILADAEDVALERHRLRIWSEQLHAAFASLNARSVELQLEAKRLSGLPQATLQLSSSLVNAIVGGNNNNNKSQTSFSTTAAPPPPPPILQNQNQTNNQQFPSSSSFSRQQQNQNASTSNSNSNTNNNLQDVLLRREAALNERERHITELFRYVLEQRSLVEKQLELIGQRIEKLFSMESSSPSPSPNNNTTRNNNNDYYIVDNNNDDDGEYINQNQNHPSGTNNNNYRHPLLQSGNNNNNPNVGTTTNHTMMLLDDLEDAERMAEGGNNNNNHHNERNSLDRALEGSYPRHQF